MCMVLYGYDASVFNAAQGSDNWLAWFNLHSVSQGIPTNIRDDLMGAELTKLVSIER